MAANTDSPYYEPLAQILGRAYGPAHIVPEELAGIPGVEEEHAGSAQGRVDRACPGRRCRFLCVVIASEDTRDALAIGRELLDQLAPNIDRILNATA